MTLLETLEEKRDEGYRAFQMPLIPNPPQEKFIGVRTPELKKLAKVYPFPPDFFTRLPHDFFEENQLHGLYISNLKDFDLCLSMLDAFLPYVDNWATCDQMRPKCFSKNLPRLAEKIPVWIQSTHTYTMRFGVEMLMTFFLGDAFEEKYLRWVSQIETQDYYGRMMIAWFYATALAKHYDAAVGYLENGVLEPWIHNKTIRKAIESCRITPEQKDYLRTLKRT